MNTVVATPCLNLRFVSSQFSLSKCSFDICSLHFNLKQNLMHLFCVTCSLSFGIFCQTWVPRSVDITKVRFQSSLRRGTSKTEELQPKIDLRAIVLPDIF